MSIASYRMATSPTDQNNQNVLAWLDRLQASVQSAGASGGAAAFRMDSRADAPLSDDEDDENDENAPVKARRTIARPRTIVESDDDDESGYLSYEEEDKVRQEAYDMFDRIVANNPRTVERVEWYRLSNARRKRSHVRIS